MDMTEREKSDMMATGMAHASSALAFALANMDEYQEFVHAELAAGVYKAGDADTPAGLLSGDYRQGADELAHDVALAHAIFSAFAIKASQHAARADAAEVNSLEAMLRD